MTREEALEKIAAVAAAGAEDVDIAEAALVIAAVARGGMDLAAARAHLAEIAQAARDILTVTGIGTTTARAVADATRTSLYRRFGYAGDRTTYDDLRNADLAAVIERRRGLPVALGILAIHVARAAGASSHGINFPGHFLVGVGTTGSAVLVDPFHDGRMVDGDDLEGLLPKGMKLAQEHLTALTDRGTLIRLQNNIVSRAREAGAWETLANALEVLVRLAPDVVRYRYELGEAYAEGGQPIAARGALRRALAEAGAADWAEAAKALLVRVSRSLN